MLFSFPLGYWWPLCKGVCEPVTLELNVKVIRFFLGWIVVLLASRGPQGVCSFIIPCAICYSFAWILCFLPLHVPRTTWQNLTLFLKNMLLLIKLFSFYITLTFKRDHITVAGVGPCKVCGMMNVPFSLPRIHSFESPIFSLTYLIAGEPLKFPFLLFSTHLGVLWVRSNYLWMGDGPLGLVSLQCTSMASLYPYLGIGFRVSSNGHSIITSCPAEECQLNLEFRPLESKTFPFSLVA